MREAITVVLLGVVAALLITPRVGSATDSQVRVYFAPGKGPQTQQQQPWKDTCGFTAEQNKAIVLDFYYQAFVKSNLSAVDLYYDPNLIQHNPFVGNGIAPVKEFLASSPPNPTMEFLRPVAEKNLVYLQVKAEGPDGKLSSTFDAFRVECGKIVEHWDTTQQVPDGPSANGNTMF